MDSQDKNDTFEDSASERDSSKDSFNFTTPKTVFDKSWKLFTPSKSELYYSIEEPSTISSTSNNSSLEYEEKPDVDLLVSIQKSPAFHENDLHNSSSENIDVSSMLYSSDEDIKDNLDAFSGKDSILDKKHDVGCFEGLCHNESKPDVISWHGASNPNCANEGGAQKPIDDENCYDLQRTLNLDKYNELCHQESTSLISESYSYKAFSQDFSVVAEGSQASESLNESGFNESQFQGGSPISDSNTNSNDVSVVVCGKGNEKSIANRETPVYNYEGEIHTKNTSCMSPKIASQNIAKSNEVPENAPVVKLLRLPESFLRNYMERMNENTLIKENANETPRKDRQELNITHQNNESVGNINAVVINESSAEFCRGVKVLLNSPEEDNLLTLTILFGLSVKLMRNGVTQGEILQYLKEKPPHFSVSRDELRQNIKSFLNAAINAKVIYMKSRRYFLNFPTEKLDVRRNKKVEATQKRESESAGEEALCDGSDSQKAIDDENCYDLQQTSNPDTYNELCHQESTSLISESDISYKAFSQDFSVAAEGSQVSESLNESGFTDSQVQGESPSSDLNTNSNDVSVVVCGKGNEKSISNREMPVYNNEGEIHAKNTSCMSPKTASQNIAKSNEVPENAPVLVNSLGLPGVSLYEKYIEWMNERKLIKENANETPRKDSQELNITDQNNESVGNAYVESQIPHSTEDCNSNSSLVHCKKPCFEFSECSPTKDKIGKSVVKDESSSEFCRCVEVLLSSVEGTLLTWTILFGLLEELVGNGVTEGEILKHLKQQPAFFPVSRYELRQIIKSFLNAAINAKVLYMKSRRYFFRRNKKVDATQKRESESAGEKARKPLCDGSDLHLRRKSQGNDSNQKKIEKEPEAGVRKVLQSSRSVGVSKCQKNEKTSKIGNGNRRKEDLPRQSSNERISIRTARSRKVLAMIDDENKTKMRRRPSENSDDQRYSTDVENNDIKECSSVKRKIRERASKVSNKKRKCYA